MIDRKENIKNILKLIKYLSPNLVCIGLQEVSFKTKEEETSFIKHLKNYGFITVYMTPNGLNTYMDNRQETLRLLIALKFKTHISTVKHVTYNNIRRNSLVFSMFGRNFSMTHLSIGEQLLKDSKENKDENDRIKNYNLEERVEQIDTILKYKPDVLFGDMNVTPKDEEIIYLEGKGLKLFSKKDGYSTPYNKVDHVFNTNNIRLKKYHNIQCNFSDHNPFIFCIDE
jgi:endonuclease/exonuclease/phosphatase family metal-dependent hydrolase